MTDQEPAEGRQAYAAMRTPVTALVALLLACAASGAAAARPYAPGMACRAVQELIGARGAAVISTSPSTYDRFVSGGRYCEPTEDTEAAWIPTSDKRDCFIGYTCKEHQRDENW